MTKKVRDTSTGEEVELTQGAARGAVAEMGLHIANRVAAGKLDLVTLPADLYTRSTGGVVQFLAERHLHQRLMFQGVGLDPAQAREAANEQWLCALPELVDRQSVLQFLALVAWGLRNRILDGPEAKMMIFLAQTHLSVLKTEPQKQPGAAPAAPATNTGKLFGNQELSGGFIDPEKGGKR